MADKKGKGGSEEGLFQRLGKLFRSGPVVKKRVRGYRAKGNSSAHDVFRKSMGHVYSTALSNFGTLDRAARYADYQQMQYCLAGDTRIAVPGGYKTLEELSEECLQNGLEDHKFVVYSYDHTKKRIVPAWGKQARQTRTCEAFKVTFDGGETITGSGNHLLMLRDGSYRRIDELRPGDSMMPFVRDDETPETAEILTMGPSGSEREIERQIFINFIREQKLLKSAVSDLLRPDITFDRILEVSQNSGFDVSQISLAMDVPSDVIADRLRANGFTDFRTFADVYRDSQSPTSSSKLEVSLDGATWVVSVEPAGVMPLYDLTVDGYKNFATDTVISHNTPEVSAALDIYCLTGDNRVPLLDGRTLTIKELFDSQEENFYVYSYDVDNSQYVPGLCKGVKVTGHNQNIVRVTFDDGTYIRVTGDHRVLLHDGTYRIAQDLVLGDSVRALTKEGSTFEKEHLIDGYEMIHLDDGTWQYTHRMVAEFFEPNGRGVVHHVNHVKKNNSPENLQFMSRDEHQEVHRQESSIRWQNNPEYAKKMAELASERCKERHRQPGWTRDVFLKRRNEVFASYTPEERLVKFGRRGSQNGMHGSARFGEKNPRWNNSFRRTFTKDELVSLILSGLGIREAMKSLPARQTDLIKACKQHGIRKWCKLAVLEASPEIVSNVVSSLREFAKPENRRKFKEVCDSIDIDKDLAYSSLNILGYKNWTAFIDSNNHRVVSVTEDGMEDVYDLTVEKFHNFAVGIGSDSSFVLVHNSEEVTASDDKGQVLHIFSENRQIQRLLEELFYDTLNVEFNLSPWVRNLVTYGDVFLFADVSPEHGVLNAITMPVNEVEREEGFDRDDPLAVRFRWSNLGGKTLENWQVIHMRLLGNDAFLPYGSSVLEPARRIWRQLILIEDSMLVYRVVRSPERRVFYIEVGAIPPDEVPNYMEQAKRTLRSNQVVDPSQGRVDLRYNPLPVWSETPVPLLDGRTITIREVAEEFNQGKVNWVYSVQDGTHKVVPGKVAWCGKNYTAQRLVKVHLDDGSWCMSAPEHPFMLRDGSPRNASDLKPGDSLMPLYRAYDKRGYPQVYNPPTEKYEFVHKMVAMDVYPVEYETTEAAVVHHKGLEKGLNNKKDNTPDNLQVMNFWEHRDFHSKHAEMTLNTPERLEEKRQKRIAYNKSDEKRKKTADDNRRLQKAQKMGTAYNGSDLHKEHNEIRREAQKRSWGEKKAERSVAMRWVIPDEVKQFVVDQVRQNPRIKREEVTEAIRSNSPLVELLRQTNAHNNRKVEKFHSSTVFGAEFPGLGWGDIREKILRGEIGEVGYKNHKVDRIEVVDGPEDVYCMTVVGSRGEDDRHNFGIQTFTSFGDEVESGVFVYNSIDEDYFLPTRGGEAGSRIESLAGGTNVTAIEDVQYIQSKLFSALKVPKAYIGFDEGIGSKSLLCLHEETPIKLLDGRTVPIGQMVEEHDDGIQNWVYTSTPGGNLVPGRVAKAWYTKSVSEIYEVEIDTGDVIRCTDNHPFMLRDGTYLRADRLQAGISLMPLYTRPSSKADGDLLNDYEMVWQDGEWKYTHKVVQDAFVRGEHVVKKARVIHHVDFDRHNNEPTNLQEMSWGAHTKLHRDHADLTIHRPDIKAKSLKARLEGWLPSDRHRELKRDLMTREANTPGYGLYEWIHGDEISGKMSEVMTENWKNPEYVEATVAGIKSALARPEVKEKMSGENHWLSKKYKEYDLAWLIRYCNEEGIFMLKSFTQRSGRRTPVGVPYVKKLLAANGFRGFRDFARAHIKKNHKVISVRKVTLDDPVWVCDLTIESDGDHHNFALGCGVYTHNSQEDIRFSRTINRIQRTVISELNKLAVIHLYANGFDGDDLLDFSLNLSNPSTVAQQQKLEIFRTKLEIAGTAPEGMVDRHWLRKNILHLTDDEIDRIEQGRIDDKYSDLKVEAIGSGGEGSSGGPPSGGGRGGGLPSLGGSLGSAGPPDVGDTSEEPGPPGAPPAGGAPGGPGGDLGLPDEVAPAGEDGDDGEDEEPAEDELPTEEDLFSSDVKLGDLLLDAGPDDDLLELDEADAEDLRTGKPPVKIDGRHRTRLDKSMYDRSRLKHHGPAALDQPDHLKMVSHTRPRDTLTDPYDLSSVNQVDAFKEGTTPIDRFLARGERTQGRMTADLQSTVKRLRGHLRRSDAPSGSSLLSEVTDPDLEDGRGGDT